MTDFEWVEDVSVDLVQHVGDDHSVLAAMLVSTQGPESLRMLGQETQEADYGRINFLMKGRHGSPFESNSMTFFVEAPIAVFREWQRHRVQSFNEESGRYTELKPRFYIPGPDRPLVQVGKPGHYEFVPGTDDQYLSTMAAIKSSCTQSYGFYQQMLDAGIAKEVARGVLPVYTMSSMYATMNARSAMAFLSLRTKELDSKFPSFPMYEIELAARKVEAAFGEIFPLTYRSFCENGRVCP